MCQYTLLIGAIVVITAAPFVVSSIADIGSNKVYVQQRQKLEFLRRLQAEQYDKTLSPHGNDTVVQVKIWVGNLRDFDDVEQTLQTWSWIGLEWFDPRLKQPELNDSIIPITFDGGDNTIIWAPSIHVQERTFKIDKYWLHGVLVNVETATGLVSMNGYVFDELHCPIRALAFPFDTQACRLTLLARGGIRLRYEPPDDNLRRYQSNAVISRAQDNLFEVAGWRMQVTDEKDFNATYNEAVMEYFDPVYRESFVGIEIKLQRKSGPFVYVWIVPPITLCMSSIVGLYYGCTSGERFSFGGAVVLTLTLMHNELRSVLAVGVDGYAILGWLYLALTISVILATLMTSLPRFMLTLLTNDNFGQKRVSEAKRKRLLIRMLEKLVGVEPSVQSLRLKIMVLNLSMQFVIVIVAVGLWCWAV